MKSKKNLLIFVLMLIMTFVLVACSTVPSDTPESSPSLSSEESVSEVVTDSEEVEISSAPSEPEQTEGSVLVAYFLIQEIPKKSLSRLLNLPEELLLKFSGLRSMEICRQRQRLKFWKVSILKLRSV